MTQSQKVELIARVIMSHLETISKTLAVTIAYDIVKALDI